MPIRAENKALYPKEWPLISLTIRALAGFKCEWCGAANGKPHPETGSKVVLTVAHLDHDPSHCGDKINLAALCQRCHNRYDAPVRRAGIRARLRATMAIGDLV